MNILITGACGFIGGNLIDYFMRNSNHDIVAMDCLTYAGNLKRLAPHLESQRLELIKGDIRSKDDCKRAMKKANIVINLAAQTHVDRSLHDCMDFVTTNMFGTWRLAEVCASEKVPMIHFSTDEVYGSIGQGSFDEAFPHHNPTSPYSVSKEAAEMTIENATKQDGLQCIMVRPSNAYGIMQYPEKLIPRMITKCLDGSKLPIFGNGLNVRQWLHVEDLCRATNIIMNTHRWGEVFNIPGNTELTNLELVKKILRYFELPDSQIEHVVDRKGHDFRYSIDGKKLYDLGFTHKHEFSTEFPKVIDWYMNHREFFSNAKNNSAFV